MITTTSSPGNGRRSSRRSGSLTPEEFRRQEAEKFQEHVILQMGTVQMTFRISDAYIYLGIGGFF
ncbi:hypothetical protein FGF66_12190 [Chlorobaculum thiosulfatiphilum]|uniref:Uncharacterized protein n=1 Tax=Chlorobaculum thiosulfatiphilum TaxID=115852 RepID=A0A5C4RXY9_CHLTI|nr:hypothetical protein [Chlorobaculum thiosulfatiphilum]TNJ36163.1 hypothetical protein FGF66_12190 [Chlorobaculum thiosulfatiphilum]